MADLAIRRINKNERTACTVATGCPNTADFEIVYMEEDGEAGFGCLQHTNEWLELMVERGILPPNTPTNLGLI